MSRCVYVGVDGGEPVAAISSVKAQMCLLLDV